MSSQKIRVTRGCILNKIIIKILHGSSSLCIVHPNVVSHMSGYTQYYKQKHTTYYTKNARKGTVRCKIAGYAL